MARKALLYIHAVDGIARPAPYNAA